MQYFVISCQILIGLIFMASAASKLLSRTAFDEFAMATRVLIGTNFAGWRGRAPDRLVSLAVVAGEAAIPILIAIPVTARAGLGIAVILLSCFCIVIGSAMRRGVHTSCRCFGASSIPLDKPHLIRNVALLIIALAGAVPGQPSHAHFGGLAIAASAALVVALLIVRLEDLIGLFTPSR